MMMMMMTILEIATLDSLATEIATLDSLATQNTLIPS
jgi:hypothetical protein